MENIKIIIGNYQIETSGEISITEDTCEEKCIQKKTVNIKGKELVKVTKPMIIKKPRIKRRRNVTTPQSVDREILRMIKKRKLQMSTGVDGKYRIPRNITEVPPTYLNDKKRRLNARSRLWARLTS